MPALLKDRTENTSEKKLIKPCFSLFVALVQGYLALIMVTKAAELTQFIHKPEIIN